MTLPFVLPPLTPDTESPIWDGNNFCVAGQRFPVLEYSSNDKGWTDELTSFHEDTAGDNHFIDKASRSYAIQQIQRHVKNKDAVILEIGCSSGFMLKTIKKNIPVATVIGADVVREPLFNLANEMPNIPLLRFNLLECPLPDNSIDVVVMLNVLEHIDDEVTALQQVKRILKPGGMVFLEVPAGPHLYDAYDKILMHYRRYSLQHLAKLVQSLGFDISKQSHLGFFIYPGFRFVKLRNKRYLGEAEAMQKQAVEQNIQRTKNNKLLHLVMKIELGLGKLLSYPKGIRCLMTCIKPK